MVLIEWYDSLKMFFSGMKSFGQDVRLALKQWSYLDTFVFLVIMLTKKLFLPCRP